MAENKYFSTCNPIIKGLLAAFLFLIPIHLPYSNIALVSALALFYCSYPFFRKQYAEINRKSFSRLFLSTFVFYLLIIASLVFSQYRAEAAIFAEYRLSMLLVPLMFFAGFTLTGRDKEVVLVGFVAGVVVKLLFFWGLAIYGLASDKLIFSNLTFSHILPLDTLLRNHRTYLSFYALMSLLIVMGSKHLRYPLWFKMSLGVLALTSIFSLESRVMIVISAALAIAFPFIVFKKKRFFKTAAITYSVLIVSTILPFGSGSYKVAKERIGSKIIAVEADQSPDSIIEAGTSQAVYANEDPRIVRWKTAADLIAERPLTGYGSGSEKKVLNARFAEKKQTFFESENLDSHNQFLSFALESGVFAAAFYAFMLFAMFLKSVKKRDLTAALFVVICSAMSLFENILNVNWMITFFVFMSSLIIFERNPTRELSD